MAMRIHLNVYTFFRFIIYLFALALLGYAGWLWMGSYKARHGGETQPNPTQIVTTSTPTPSEEPAPVQNDYVVADHLPRSIMIPSINVHHYIQRVGTDNQGRIAVPSNIYFAGWFTGSELPGNPGVSIIDGHVHGRYDPGIFYNLHKLTPGDEIRIEYGDRSWKSFTVTGSKTIDAHDPKTLMAPITSEDVSVSELRLITCDGYDKPSGEYTKRLVVTAR